MLQDPLFLANLLLIIHFSFVIAVILPVPIILIGKFCKWRFVGNRWFRLLHMAAIGFVVVNTWLGEMCPLTIWENDLRMQAGQDGYGESFIAYWMGNLLYHDLPAWIFAVAYSLFASLILALFFIAPVRWRG